MAPHSPRHRCGSVDRIFFIESHSRQHIARLCGQLLACASLCTTQTVELYNFLAGDGFSKMTIAPFKSDKERISFARKFLRDRVGPFRADLAICLTADANGHRAEFPALITCIGFAELLSGLYAGNLESNGLNNLQKYAARSMDTTKYDPLRLQILYFVFRHKLAHLSFPHFVFDTASRKEFQN